MKLLGAPRTAARRLRRARWQVKAALVAAILLVTPILLLALIYVLPPDTAVALGKPLLGLLSDSPPLPSDLDPVSERSVLLAADGSELATLYDEVNRVRISLDEVADVAVDAVLASEDNRFYDHPGINHRAVIRAALINLRSGGIEQGGSTITQQLVKNVYLDGSQTARRKFTEAWYALELEDRLTKDAILERYLNEAYFGNGAYGIAAAAEVYFNTTARELTVAQAATLVGTIPAPSARNPVADLDEARRARNAVIDRMVASGRLDAQEAVAARNADMAVEFTPPPPPQEPFFVAYVRHQLLNDARFDDAFGTDAVERERVIYGGGLTVHTTLNPGMQRLAYDVIEDQMGNPASSPLATIVAVEPGTGAIKTMAVGPKEFGSCDDDADDCPRTMVNPAAPGLGGSGRQPGSAFKPFVLTAALQEGVPPGWEQRTDDGVSIPGCSDDGDDYEPDNYSDDPGVKDMREAIRVSNNVYHARLAGLLGPQLLVEAAENAGLTGGILPEECSVALGSGSVFPLHMAAAYATFANAGEYCAPLAVTSIEFGRRGDDVVDFEPACEERIDADVAARMNHLLQAPVDDGTATAVQRADRPVAGKTGTTDDYRDAWFVGYVPQLVTATWIGFEQPRPLEDVLGVERVTGGSIPATLWRDYMHPILDDYDVEQFADAEALAEIAVPDFVEDDADDVLDDYEDDFTLNLEVRRVRDYRDKGTVVGHKPEAGEDVVAGTLVTLRVSDGEGRPPRIPDVVGLDETEATQVLSDAGYEVTVSERQRELEEGEPTPVPEGTVVRMDPRAGTRLRPEEPVEIVIAVYERVEPEPTEEPDDDADDAPDTDDTDDTDGDDTDDTDGTDDGNNGDPDEGDSGGNDDDGGRPDPDDEVDDAPTPAARGRVKFARVVADPDGDDVRRNGGEFVTLAVGNAPADVSGWSISVEGGATLQIGQGYALAAGSTLDVHTGPGINRPPERYFNGRSSPVLPDDGAVLVLLDDRGREVTRTQY